MSSPSSGPLRALRAAVLGTVCVSLAAGGHLAAGGAAPSIPVLAVLALPMMMVAALLTHRRCGFPTLLASIGLSQLALHEALMWAAQSARCAVTGDPTGHLAHLAHLGHLSRGGPDLHCSGMTGTTGMAGMAGMSTMSSSGSTHWAPTAMVLAHAIAAALSALALAHGEALLWLLARIWSGARRVAAPAPVRVIGTTIRLAPAQARPAPAPRVARGPAPRRGPPVVVMAHL